MVTQARSPHYLLFSGGTGPAAGTSGWNFVLQSLDRDEQFAASDVEPGIRASRLELLAVVRGLEAIDQPARVTLVTPSRYVARGIRRELSHWRERHWHWERFGTLVPIRDRDLWQRVDRALQFHQVECIRWRAGSHLAPGSDPHVQGAGAVAPGKEPALLIVPRATSRRTAQGCRETALVRAINRLRDGVLAPFSAILRPTFTRAA